MRIINKKIGIILMLVTIELIGIVIYISYAFYSTRYNKSTFEINGLSVWETSQVTDMCHTFEKVVFNAQLFNLDLSNWNIFKVSNSGQMFEVAVYSAKKWNVSKVTNYSSFDESVESKLKAPIWVNK